MPAPVPPPAPRVVPRAPLSADDIEARGLTRCPDACEPREKDATGEGAAYLVGYTRTTFCDPPGCGHAFPLLGPTHWTYCPTCQGNGYVMPAGAATARRGGSDPMPEAATNTPEEVFRTALAGAPPPFMVDNYQWGPDALALAAVYGQDLVGLRFAVVVPCESAAQMEEVRSLLPILSHPKGFRVDVARVGAADRQGVGVDSTRKSNLKRNAPQVEHAIALVAGSEHVRNMYWFIVTGENLEAGR